MFNSLFKVDNLVLAALLLSLVFVVGCTSSSAPGSQLNSSDNSTVMNVSGDIINEDNVTVDLTPTVFTRMDSNYGVILVDGLGKNLYRYSKDDPGSSNCYNECSVAWPPMLVNSSSQLKVGSTLVKDLFSFANRSDGTVQVVYDGVPLYYYSRDSTAGEMKGNGINDQWFVVKLNDRYSLPESTEDSTGSGDSGKVVSYSPMDQFARCIASNGAKLYGASWCPHCTDQKGLFGNSTKYLPYVECSTGQWSQAQECTDAGIRAYPTWIIDGTKTEGKQTLSKLASLTKCQLPK